MIEPSKIKLLNNVDATNAIIGESECITLNYAWSIEIIKDNCNGNPKIFIQHSNDNTNWADYVSDDEAVLIDDSPFIIIDEFFPSRNIRLRLEPNGNTTGTITALLSLKIT